jgi:hypothetical protein
MTAAVTFHDTILAVHIAAVVVAFGVTFSYPLLLRYAARAEPEHLPAFWRAVAMLGQRLVGPGLVVVLVAGVYLASDGHQWKKFYVGWGFAAVLALGALGGALMTPTERRLAEVAQQDIDAAREGPVQFGEEYQRLRRRWNLGGTAIWVIVLVTIFFMANHVGA